jgi:PAS domain S-box-containing protein
MSASPSRLAAYGLAFALSVIAAALVQFYEPVRLHLPFVSLLVVVVVSAWYGGLGPGLLAAVLTAIAGAYFVLPPVNSFDISFNNAIRLGVFLLVALLISSLSNASTRAQTESARLLERERQSRAAAEEAERRSEESAALLDALMASSPVGLALIDRDFRYVRVNDALASINGIPREDHLGRTVRDIVPNLAPKAEALYRQVLETGKPVVGEVVSGEIPSLPGEQRHRLVNYYPVSVKGGPVTGLGIAVVDITDRVRADAERQRTALHMQTLADVSRVFAEAGPDLQTVLDTITQQVAATIGDACIMRLVSEDGRLLRAVSVSHRDPEAIPPLREAANAAYDADQGLGGRVFQSGQPLFIPEISSDQLAAISHQSFREYLERTGGSGMITVPLRVNRNTIGVLAVIRAQPGRPYVVEDQRLLQDIADRAALAIDNARLLHETQEEMRRREEFLSIASHELKTPLTTVKGYVQLLSKELSRPEPDQGFSTEILADLNAQVLRFEGLVADLLDASRIQRDRLDLRREPVDLSELARKVLNRFEQSTELHDNHVLTLDAPAPVTGSWDIDRLDQVLTNLLSNAIKYSPDGGEVRLRVRQADSEAEIIVTDNGIGIAQAEQAELFQPFIRGAAARSITGTGLGLYITGQIVERHGGRIQVESEPGKGSAFIVRLPLDPAKSVA